jgi:hypothetical protein
VAETFPYLAGDEARPGSESTLWTDDRGAPGESAAPAIAWPELSHQAESAETDQDRQEILRAWRRERRLDDEQRGRLWNE